MSASLASDHEKGPLPILHSLHPVSVNVFNPGGLVYSLLRPGQLRSQKSPEAYLTINQTNRLEVLDAAKRQLAELTDVSEVKRIRDKTEALRDYVRKSGESKELVNVYAEVKIRAERRAGEMLSANIQRGRPPEKGHRT